MRTTRSWAAVAALPLLAALTLGGCGQNKPPICSGVKALQTSVDNLKKVDVRASGLPALSNQAQQVRDDVSRVVQDARSQYQPQIDGMKSEVARLSSSISTAKADPTAATLSAVRSSVRDVAPPSTTSGRPSPAPADVGSERAGNARPGPVLAGRTRGGVGASVVRGSATGM